MVLRDDYYDVKISQNLMQLTCSEYHLSISYLNHSNMADAFDASTFKSNILKLEVIFLKPFDNLFTVLLFHCE